MILLIAERKPLVHWDVNKLDKLNLKSFRAMQIQGVQRSFWK